MAFSFQRPARVLTTIEEACEFYGLILNEHKTGILTLIDTVLS